MKKIIRLSLLLLVTTISVTLLTSGISKKMTDGGGFKDIVDELYDQAVKQNNNLQSIEDGIEKFYRKKNDALEKYNSFTNYNSRYYSDARAKAGNISDTAARKKAFDIINRSETTYRTTLSGWQNNIAVMNAQEKELNDLHTLLKIMISEPAIKKYQDGNFPDDSKLKEAGNDLQSIIRRIREITN